ncbi:MAG: peptidase, partial [Parafilimonas sp.]
MKIFLACICFAFISINLTAQPLPVLRNYGAAYNNQTRSADGKPGAKYWQNTAAYTINVSFAPATRIIAGGEEIIYTNNSPDTLQEVWFKLYPNLYQKGAERDMRVKAADVTDGVRIENFAVDGVNENTGVLEISATNMRVEVPDLLPGKQMKFNITFSYELNRTSHIRTGMVDDSSAFIAYFFPRIAVYDDVDGWNKIPYAGSAEFYNDFCDFMVNITVPNNYIVCATGNLLNANDVYAPQVVQRITEAEKNDGVTKVIDVNDLQSGNITAQHATNTWKFKA